MAKNKTSSQILNIIKQNQQTNIKTLQNNLQISKSAIYRNLDKLIAKGKIIKKNNIYTLSISNTSTNTKTSEDPPLVDIEVSNPVTYFKHWWKKIMGNEGMNLRMSLKIKPLTALGITIIIASFGFGIGSWSTQKALAQTPIGQYITIKNIENKAVVGRIHYLTANDSFYIISSDDRAIKITNFDKNQLFSYIGRKVIIIGQYFPKKDQLDIKFIDGLNY